MLIKGNTTGRNGANIPLLEIQIVPEKGEKCKGLSKVEVLIHVGENHLFKHLFGLNTYSGVNHFAVLKQHQSRNSPDAVANCYVGIFVGVELAELYLVAQLFGQLFDNGCY